MDTHLCNFQFPACEISYNEEINKQYFGAQQDNVANTENECRNLCSADVNCAGYGVNTNANPGTQTCKNLVCWIFLFSISIKL